MKALVDQLLDLSRLEADAVDIRPTALAIRPRVEEIVAAALGEDASVVEIDVDSRLVAEVDPDALDRIVSNLIVNALRYGAAPVRDLAPRRTTATSALTVEDRGEGVPPEFVPDLFERFTREPCRALATGTGLGLAIARSYAQAHRGDLIYEPRIRRARASSSSCRSLYADAGERSRTSKGFRPTGPEPVASASSATPARAVQASAADAGFAGVGPKTRQVTGPEKLSASARLFRAHGPGWSRTTARRFEVCRSIH